MYRGGDVPMYTAATITDCDFAYASAMAQALAKAELPFIADVAKWLCVAAQKSGIAQTTYVLGVALQALPTSSPEEVEEYYRQNAGIPESNPQISRQGFLMRRASFNGLRAI